MQAPRRREEQIVGALSAVFLVLIGTAALMFLGLRFGLGVNPIRPFGPAPAELGAPPGQVAAAPSVTPTPAAVAPAAGGTPVPTKPPTPIGPRPSIAQAAQAWIQAWEGKRFGDMYRMLSAAARQSIPEEKFAERYQTIAEGATIVGAKFVLPSVREPAATADRADVRFGAQFQTARFGELNEQYVLPLALEQDGWKVEWTPDLILQGLAPDRSVRVFEEDPVRGQIIDRNGVPLAAIARVPQIGVIPGGLKEPEKTIGELAGYLQLDPNVIRKKIESAQPDWWIPLAVLPAEKREEVSQRFGMTPGVLIEEKETRVYPHGAVAPHIIGYVSPVLGDDLKALSAKGYTVNDVVGRGGVEASFEETLAGQRGGRLLISDPNGDTIRVVAERPARPGAHVQLTIDVEVQKKAEAALGDRVGSLVLMDPRDNSVIAMASSPRFDPNGFVFGFSPEEWKRLNDDPKRPFQHRPAMSTYATGSIFKVITMAAGIERGGFVPNSRFNCGGSWSLPGVRVVWGDWVKTGHGALDLSQGLVESCDIVFYELGKKLHFTDPEILPYFTRQFGLGESTGINGIDDAPGIVPSEEWKQKALGEGYWPGDAINFSIGQGYLDSTPLQMANVYSTIANNGVHRTPLLVRRVLPAMGTEQPKEFAAKEVRRVPVSGTTFQAIREAMVRVTTAPKGTGYYAFNGYKIPTAGKTGSAENQHKEAHAWFAGFAPAHDPQVVVIAMVEGGEMGGVVAAPLGRKGIELLLGPG